MNTEDIKKEVLNQINMKQFSVEEYLKNPRDLVTRGGQKARILCCDLKTNSYPVVAAVMNKGIELPLTYTKQGKVFPGHDSPEDLFFAPEIHEGWANVFGGADGNSYVGDSRIFKSKEDAEKEGKKWKDYIATVKIEWEE